MNKTNSEKQTVNKQKNTSNSLLSSSKRIGVAKEEMKDFDITLEEFNSITTKDFDI